ncbi:MAG: PolC-type DNA polymerase III [Candidatus Woesearchaeota archaeon]
MPNLSPGNEFVIVDLETTGLSARRHKITEIAAVKLKDGRIIDKFETLVNPGTPIPKHITKITGIDDEMVENAPSTRDALTDFLMFAGDATLVAHNASFDMSFLRHHAEDRLGLSILNPSLCTMQLSKSIVPEISSRALTSLCSFFGVANENAHRAMSDVKATYQVFNHLKDMMEDTADEVLQQHIRIPVKKATDREIR